MIDVADIIELIPDHLAQQRWYDHDTPPSSVALVDSEQWLDGDPSLWWLLVDVADQDTPHGRYQLIVGVRTSPADHEFLRGKEAEVLGGVDTTDGLGVVYDAVIDAPLAIEVLHRVAPGATATSVRPLTVEQSNTSIVYDDRIIVKIFRRVYTGTNPDVDAVARLLEEGYEHVPDQQGVLERPDGSGEAQQLAVARTFLTGASDGWHLALTSLRILFATHEEASESGGDFGPDARRLGVITADLHLRLARAYGTTEADLSSWVAGFRSQLDRVRQHVPAEAISDRYDEIAEMADPGPAMRIHGDLHLGQTLRADAGWYVIDFEGEPARPPAERVRPSSPLRDVAGMLRSLHYAAEVARWERGHDDAESFEIADDWERWTREQFLAGYFGTSGIEELLPDESTRDALLQAFELDKAVYEVAYEVGYRPTWAAIPLGAIERLLS